MRIYISSIIKRFFSLLGLDIRRHNKLDDLLMPTSDFVEVVFDVGANAGQYALEMRKFGFKGLIISIEPLLAEHEVLLKLSQNDSNWIIEERILAGPTNGTGRINRSENSFSSSILPILPLHLKSAPKSQYVSQEIVPMRTLDSIWKQRCSRFTKVGLKIDVQGYEQSVLEGAQLLLQNCAFIQIEMSVLPLYENQSLYFETDTFLRSLGYVLWKIKPGFEDSSSGQILQMDAIYLRDSHLEKR